ncbi:MAG: hypothetical protein QOG70_2152, partial [Solirubrobacteraceae bacterium]|nr:hypothetical protein [Solirubrobacteraceae bacterium]
MRSDEVDPLGVPARIAAAERPSDAQRQEPEEG